MKKIKKVPVEYFCYDCENKDTAFQLAVKQQYCKYIKDTCAKPRKSTPEIKVGICTVGATVAKSKDVKPVIICPHRFKEEVMFEIIREKYLSAWKNVKWIQEVNLGVGGNVDYVAVEIDSDNAINDFLCVEIQAGGTTRTPYPYIEDFKKFGYFKNFHQYGINWANEFQKTMMQQAYKKGRIVEHWKRKIVFVIQDVAMEYLRSASDCSKLVDFDKNLPVDFCMLSLAWTDGAWHLSFNSIKSTSMDGINTILGGAAPEDWPTEEEFKKSILKKGIADGVLKGK